YKSFTKKNKVSKERVERDNTKLSVTFRRDRWDVENLSMDEILKLNSLCIYTDKENKDDLMHFENVNIHRSKRHSTNTKNFKLNLFHVATRNYNKIKEATEGKNNFYTYDEFMKNKDNIKFKVLTQIYVGNKVRK